MSAGRPVTPVTPVRVLLTDDHPVVRQGLQAMLAAEPGIEVVAEAASGPEAVELAKTSRPHVVLMDLRMPDGGGVPAISQLTSERPSVRVVVLTTYDTDADILRAVEAGASGYLLKDTPRAELVAAIRAAARGETVLAPTVAGRLMRQMRASTKLGVSGRTAAVTKAIENGDLPQPGRPASGG